MTSLTILKQKTFSFEQRVRIHTLPAQLEHAPALQLYGRSRPASSAASRIYVSSAAVVK